MMLSRLSLIVLAATLALPVLADGVDECIKLSQAGVGEEVVVAWAERQGSMNMTAGDVLRMKDAKVPDRAIAAMLRAGRFQMRGNDVTTFPEQAQVQSVPASQTVEYQPTTTSYATPTTTYVPSTTTYVETPVYYSSYGYPYYGYGYRYGYPYYGYGYGYGYPYYGGYGIGLNFNFGGRGHGYYGGYRGGYGGGYGGYRGGLSGGFRTGFSSGGGHGFSGGGHSFNGGGHGGRR